MSMDFNTDDEDEDKDWVPGETHPDWQTTRSVQAVAPRAAEPVRLLSSSFLLGTTHSAAQTDIYRRYAMISLMRSCEISRQNLPHAMLTTLLAYGADANLDNEAIRGELFAQFVAMSLSPSALSTAAIDFAMADRILTVQNLLRLQQLLPAGIPLKLHVMTDDTGLGSSDVRLLNVDFWNPELKIPDSLFVAYSKLLSTTADDLCFLDWKNLCDFLTCRVPPEPVPSVDAGGDDIKRRKLATGTVPLAVADQTIPVEFRLGHVLGDAASTQQSIAKKLAAKASPPLLARLHGIQLCNLHGFARSLLTADVEGFGMPGDMTSATLQQLIFKIQYELLRKRGWYSASLPYFLEVYPQYAPFRDVLYMLLHPPALIRSRWMVKTALVGFVHIGANLPCGNFLQDFAQFRVTRLSSTQQSAATEYVLWNSILRLAGNRVLLAQLAAQADFASFIGPIFIQARQGDPVRCFGPGFNTHQRLVRFLRQQQMFEGLRELLIQQRTTTFPNGRPTDGTGDESAEPALDNNPPEILLAAETVFGAKDDTDFLIEDNLWKTAHPTPEPDVLRDWPSVDVLFPRLTLALTTLRPDQQFRLLGEITLFIQAFNRLQRKYNAGMFCFPICLAMLTEKTEYTVVFVSWLLHRLQPLVSPVPSDVYWIQLLNAANPPDAFPRPVFEAIGLTHDDIVPELHTLSDRVALAAVSYEQFAVDFAARFPRLQAIIEQDVFAVSSITQKLESEFSKVRSVHDASMTSETMDAYMADAINVVGRERRLAYAVTKSATDPAGRRRDDSADQAVLFATATTRSKTAAATVVAPAVLVKQLRRYQLLVRAEPTLKSNVDGSIPIAADEVADEVETEASASEDEAVSGADEAATDATTATAPVILDADVEVYTGI